MKMIFASTAVFIQYCTSDWIWVVFPPSLDCCIIRIYMPNWRVLSLCTKFEVRSSSRSDDALPVSALVGLVTLTFELESEAHAAHGVDNLLTNFGLSRAFRSRSRLIGKHLSDASCDLAILTIVLEGHGACRWSGCLCSVCVPNLTSVGLHVRKMDICCVSINRPGDLDLLPSDL